MIPEICLLGVGSWLVEMVLGAKIRPLRHLAAYNVLTTLGVSLFITSFMSAIFGAKGVTVLTASILSAVLSTITYRLLGVAHYGRKLKSNYRTRTNRIRNRFKVSRSAAAR